MAGGPAVCDGQTLYALDNCAICRLVLDGEEWSSVQQLFEASKFANPDFRATIRAVRPRRMGARLSAADHERKIRELLQLTAEGQPLVEGFRPLETMYVANRLKFEQDLECRKVLLQSKGPIEAAPADGEWQLWNSRILERLREELRPLAERDVEKHEALMAEFRKARDYDDASAQATLDAARAAFGAHLRFVQAALLDGRAFDLYMHPLDMVTVLRDQVAFHLGIGPSRLQLVLGGRELQDSSTIEDSEVTDGSVVTVVISSPVPRECMEGQLLKSALHDELRAGLEAEDAAAAARAAAAQAA